MTIQTHSHCLSICRGYTRPGWVAALWLALAVSRALGAEPSCETFLSGDYDGDRRSDPTIVTRSLGSWQIWLSRLNYTPVSAVIGATDFTPLTGDFDGDGIADPAIYQDATGLWLINLSSLGYALETIELGGSGWTPVPADFDGDGKTDPAVYENATGLWLASLSSHGYTPAAFPSIGDPSYTAVPADFDGDRKADPAVYGNGIWGILLSSQGYALATLASGVTGSIPIAADFDGDRKADLATIQEATGQWLVRLSSIGYAAGSTQLGGPGMTFLATDFDGDRRADPAVYQESSRTLTVRLSEVNYQPGTLVMGTPPAMRVLILYDSLGTYGWWGRSFARLLQNLIAGHFDLPCRIKPIEAYQAGDMAHYNAVFYIGITYDNPLPPAFYQDVLASTNTLCWIGYNLRQVAWTANSEYNPVFNEKFGFQFEGIESGFTAVAYKGKSLAFPDTNADFGVVSVVNSNMALAKVSAYRGQTNDSSPYITRGSNLWYVADNPIVSDTIADRTLVFADILHDILGIEHATNHLAVIRIEDVNAQTTVATLQPIADYLRGQNIPFVVSLIPEYRDPLGIEHQGVPTQLELSDNPALVKTLLNITTNGGQIIQHGYTHQYDSTPNPIGATAADYEFYRVVAVNGTNIMLGSLIEDTPQWAGGRVLTGKSLLAQYGLTPIAWLTPHYFASEMDYGVFQALYSLTLDRGEYFAVNNEGVLQNVEQVMPFLIHRDEYGLKRVPETIGYVSPTENIMPSNLVAYADANLVVRDGWAGCYYHWFLSTNSLPELVTGLTNLGYRFTTIDPNME